ncbi:hypothetical protein [Pseudomonas sp. UBA6323]|uniref:hypothetical protein n=1 Tax=Pseudomonas sp. UBA6323 TaxID=1947329 RepID=UPI0025DB1C8A|nr:hypothetical protein [Pseudomonas sp. UBA6323]
MKNFFDYIGPLTIFVLMAMIAVTVAAVVTGKLMLMIPAMGLGALAMLTNIANGVMKCTERSDHERS